MTCGPFNAIPLGKSSLWTFLAKFFVCSLFNCCLLFFQNQSKSPGHFFVREITGELRAVPRMGPSSVCLDLIARDLSTEALKPLADSSKERITRNDACDIGSAKLFGHDRIFGPQVAHALTLFLKAAWSLPPRGSKFHAKLLSRLVSHFIRWQMPHFILRHCRGRSCFIEWEHMCSRLLSSMANAVLVSSHNAKQPWQ